MHNYLQLAAILILCVAVGAGFFAAFRVWKFSSSKELSLLESKSRIPIIVGGIGALLVIASSILYSVSASFKAPVSTFDCVLGRPYPPTSMACTDRSGENGVVSWKVTHNGQSIFEGAGPTIDVKIGDSGDYEVESRVTKNVLFWERSGSSKNTFKVENKPAPEVQIRTVPFSFRGNLNLNRRTQTFQAESGERIIGASVQIVSSNNAEALIVSKNDTQVVLEMRSTQSSSCLPGPFGACKIDDSWIEGRLVVTVEREAR